MQKIDFKDCVNTYLKNSWWKLAVIVLVVAVDLVSKALIVPQDETLWAEVPIIADLIVISPTTNKGAGFSSFYGQTTLLIVLTIIFVLGITTYDLFSKQISKLYVLSSGLILAGAIGNFVDRVLFGYVRDFVYLKFINFPVFNVADISLTIGVVLLFVYIVFFSSKKDERVLANNNNQNEKIMKNFADNKIENNNFETNENLHDEKNLEEIEKNIENQNEFAEKNNDFEDDEGKK